MANQQTGKQTLNWRWSRYDSHNMRDKGTTDNQEAHTFQQRTRRDYSKINLPNVASQTNSTAATSVAQKGNFWIALSSQKEKNNQWKIDSGVSDHLTGNTDLFHNYSLCYENFKVCITNGSMFKVARIRSICLTKDLILKSVLLVPNLTCNLL